MFVHAAVFLTPGLTARSRNGIHNVSSFRLRLLRRVEIMLSFYFFLSLLRSFSFLLAARSISAASIMSAVADEFSSSARC